MITTRYYRSKLPKDATAAERACADRWIRTTGRKACRVWLVVGNQYFQVGIGEDWTPEEANWHCWMLAKALRKIEAKQIVERMVEGSK